MTDKSKKNVSEAEKQIDFGFIKVEEAKKEDYRFFSFGDAMLII